MLFIAEKRDLAKAIVEGLGGGSEKKGYFLCGEDIVTWCVGHMLQLCDPEDYDPALHKWKLDDLPLVFMPYRKKPIAKTKTQLDIILKLLKKADMVVNAGDPDSEGQLLVDEILVFAGYHGPAKRLLINDNNIQVVQKALGGMRDNAEFQGMSKAAEGRQIADFLYGINMTRLYTIAAQREGYIGTLSVGRVLNGVLGLIVRRDLAHANHQKQYYYTVGADFDFDGQVVTATYRPADTDDQDGAGHLAYAEAAQKLATEITNKPATIASVLAKNGKNPPPLPFSLLKLQSEANKSFGLLPDTVKDITQSLRDKAKLITYNRSDCEYLSDEQHQDAPAVMAAVLQNLPELASWAEQTNPAIKGRAFNSSKVSAHHGIVPTQAAPDMNTLTADEKRVYALIAKRYLLQFIPDHEYETQTTTIKVGERVFTKTTTVTTVPGWKGSFNQDTEPQDKEAPESVGPCLTEGMTGKCIRGECTKSATTPKPLFSVSSLLENLTSVADEIKDGDLRRILIERDKQKAGENGGIGTPATRDTIIKNLFERGYVEIQKNGKTQRIVSTKLGRDVYAALPDMVRFPDMTAIFQKNLDEIENGELDVKSFVERVVTLIAEEVKRVMDTGLNLNIEKFPCPSCGNALLKKTIGKRTFWGCVDYPRCKTALPDNHGTPGTRPEPTGIVCPDCHKPMVIRHHTTGDFLGCTGYPQCKKTMELSAMDRRDKAAAPTSHEHHK